MRRAIGWMAAMLAWTPALEGQSPRGYSIWHPVPRAELGALSSDRPGNGENPFSLAAGHYQLEIGALGYTRVGTHLPGAASVGAGSLKLRAGLLPGAEVQVLFDGYKWARSGDGNWSRASGGFTARGKVNLWGNDGGATAFALIPSAGLGRDAEGRWLPNGGLVATLGLRAPLGWSAGLTVSGLVAAQHQAPDVAGGTAVLGLSHTLHGSLGLALEATAIRADFSAGSTEFRLGGALLAGVGSSLQLDGGVDLGLSAGSEAIRTYLGLVRRF